MAFPMMTPTNSRSPKSTRRKYTPVGTPRAANEIESHTGAALLNYFSFQNRCLMDDELKLPSLVAASRIKMLAIAFGAPDDNQTVEGIQNPFNRDRCRARIRFEERKAANNRRELCFSAGSPDGSFERVPASKREDALAGVRRAHADLHAASKDAMRHPAILRATMAKLMEPFEKDDDNG